jgi:hypothetical protein
MEKRVKVSFKGQAKAMVEEVTIEYFGECSENYISNEDILNEVKELTEKASAYAKYKTLEKQ